MQAITANAVERAADRPHAPGTGGSALLSVRDIAVRFGGIVSLDDITFDLDQGLSLGLIGPDGANKTTLFNGHSRLYTPDRGDIGGS